MSAKKRLDAERRSTAMMLRGELTKVRCWVSGFNDGRRRPGSIEPSIPGEDSLRLTIMFLDKLISERAGT